MNLFKLEYYISCGMMQVFINDMEVESMSIDFSKAPEGATHYSVTRAGVVLWHKGRVDGVFYRTSDGPWRISSRRLSDDGVHRIPTFEPFVSVEDAPTTGSKHDSGKPLIGAVPPNALLAVAKVLTFGAEKYGRDNWRQVENAETRYLDAALRHINAYQRSESVDPESGESHLAHAVCGLMFMLELQEGK